MCGGWTISLIERVKALLQTMHRHMQYAKPYKKKASDS